MLLFGDLPPHGDACEDLLVEVGWEMSVQREPFSATNAGFTGDMVLD